MITLKDIDVSNYRIVSGLKIAEGQQGFVAPAVSILARAYAMRAQNARAFAVCDDESIVGVVLVRDIDDDPPCYDLDQFMIDERFQRKGYGRQALRLVVDMLSSERKYKCIELCVKIKAENAIKLYKSEGFYDTGYIDPDEPDAYILRYDFASALASN